MSDSGDRVKRHAKQLFEQISDPWPEGDLWSSHTKRTIADFVYEFMSCNTSITRGAHILNVGSHGNMYGISNENHFHVDIAEKALESSALACVGDAEQLPFADGIFDLVLCVGSVVNYCVAARAIGELGRVLKPGGWLLLEFETSESLEFIATSDYGMDVTLVRTFYNGSLEHIYVYSRKYIEGALAARGLRITSLRRFHVFSPLLYRLTKRERLASIFSTFDRFLHKIPFFQRHSANFLMAAYKGHDQT